MKNKILQQTQYEHPKPNFFKAKLIKLFKWILGKGFIIQQTRPMSRYEWLHFKDKQSLYELPNLDEYEQYL
tara:strand:- start:502 stop:714 length:213 start_codon:yes stop_codon:yes gene_type:complete